MTATWGDIIVAFDGPCLLEIRIESGQWPGSNPHEIVSLVGATQLPIKDANMLMTTAHTPTHDVSATVNLADVISALSYALDITEGQPEGHAARSCLIAMRIAETIGLSVADRSALFYGALLKDAGCSSNAAKVCSLFAADDRAIKQSFKTTDWTSKTESLKYLFRHAAPGRSPLGRATTIAALALNMSAGKELIQTRCSRGADIVRKLGFPSETIESIRALDEHWDGRGEPLGLKGEQIPLLGRIVGLAQTVEVYFSTYGLYPAIAMAEERSGKWFDPDLVRALSTTCEDTLFWSRLDDNDPRELLARFEPEETRLLVNDDRLDDIAEGFADVIDAKSPWTCRHSHGVAEAMVGILRVQGYDESEVRYWRLAALLHDIGKLGVSNLILDKPGKLTSEEFMAMRQHVDHSRRILRMVPCFSGFADMAAAHHEKLDGSGYSLGLTASELSPEARVLCVADIFDALSANRPYRPRQLSLDEVLKIMGAEAGPKICPIAFEALCTHLQLG